MVERAAAIATATALQWRRVAGRKQEMNLLLSNRLRCLSLLLWLLLVGGESSPLSMFIII